MHSKAMRSLVSQLSAATDNNLDTYRVTAWSSVND